MLKSPSWTSQSVVFLLKYSQCSFTSKPTWNTGQIQGSEVSKIYLQKCFIRIASHTTVLIMQASYSVLRHSCSSAYNSCLSQSMSQNIQDHVDVLVKVLNVYCFQVHRVALISLKYSSYLYTSNYSNDAFVSVCGLVLWLGAIGISVYLG